MLVICLFLIHTSACSKYWPQENKTQQSSINKSIWQQVHIVLQATSWNRFASSEIWKFGRAQCENNTYSFIGLEMSAYHRQDKTQYFLCWAWRRVKDGIACRCWSVVWTFCHIPKERSFRYKHSVTLMGNYFCWN